MTGGPTPAPGWYPDQSGHLRWWDGAQWGPYAPPPTDSGRSLAIVAHLGMFAGGFVLPLVIYLTEGKKNDFVRHHSREALNFQITYTLLLLGAMVVFFAGFLVDMAVDEGVGLFFPPVFPLMFLVWGAGVAAAVVGAVQANQRQWWRYPVSIRFVKGSEVPRHPVGDHR